MKLLYVTWDGPTHNYLEGLFFPIFAKLRAHGVSTHVLQFSWDLPSFEAQVTAAAKAFGVGYEAHAVPRRPIQAATALAISTGAVQLVRSVRRTKADVVMPRAHIPGAMALLAAPLMRTGLVWDSDGLMPDERVDFGGWSTTGVNYRALRAVERSLLTRADAVLTRTEAGRAVLAERQTARRFVVVPNGKNADEFRPATTEERTIVRASLSLAPDAPLLIYVGSIGPQYRPREMARLFAEVHRRRPDAHLLALTGAHAQMADALRAAQLPSSSWTTRRVPASEVASLVRAADAGISFREPSLSMRAVCPIKIVEYLLSGVPVLSNAGVGDLDVLFARSRAGHLAPDFSPAALRALAGSFIDDVLPAGDGLRAEARALGVAEFSLASCAAGYHQALQSL